MTEPRVPDETPTPDGPYRFRECLGRGGMGEVWRAEDTRLGRTVAIKRLRRGDSESHERRTRLQREARAVARLNHPAIVQIYDLFEDGGDDYLVFEFLAGGTLAERLVREGPLSRSALLTLGIALAEGLAVAHEAGVIHRDLKTENILLTCDGQAKIADFGIARAPGDGEAVLTAPATALGTSRAMSPEQARGAPVDARSDLFSLGVLLFEAATGRSPFRAGNALATLRRVIEDTPPPLLDLAPQVGPELSALVAYLLQKEVNLRPRSARQVATALRALAGGTGTFAGDGTAEATILGDLALSPNPDASASALGTAPWRRVGRSLGLAGLLALALWLAAGRLAPPREARVIVVAPPQVTGEAAPLLADAVRASLLSSLTGFRDLAVLDPGRAAPGTAAELLRAWAADEVVTTELHCRPRDCTVQLSRVASPDAALRWTRSFDLPREDLAIATTATETYARAGFVDARLRSDWLPVTLSAEQIATYLTLARRLDELAQHPDSALELATRDLAEAAPEFVGALMLDAEVARLRFYQSRSPRDLARARARLDAALAQAPSDPRILSARFLVALAAGDLPAAEGELTALAAAAPGDLAVEDRRADLLEARGEAAAALAVLRAAGERRPDWRRLANLARMEMHLGQPAAAREHLRAILHRMPGNVQARSDLARLELLEGDLERAVALYRELAGDADNPVDRSNLALALLLSGHFEAARDDFARVYRSEPENSFFALNLADAEALVGNGPSAEGLYRRVAAATAETSPDDWQVGTVRAQALAHLGRPREAVAALQKALAAAPDDNQAAFEAALVFTLVGDRASALVQVERAIAAGYGERWFRLPWFDSWRGDGEFEALLTPRRGSSGG